MNLAVIYGLKHLTYELADSLASVIRPGNSFCGRSKLSRKSANVIRCEVSARLGASQSDTRQQLESYLKKTYVRDVVRDRIEPGTRENEPRAES